MVKAVPATTSTPTARNTPSHLKQTDRTSQTPARKLSTQQVVAHIWDSLDWPRTLQIAVLMAGAGIAIFAVLAGLGLLTQTAGAAATWPVSVSITGTVTIQIARHKRR